MIAPLNNHIITEILQKERQRDKPISLFIYSDIEKELSDRRYWQSGIKILKEFLKRSNIEIRKGRHYFSDRSYLKIYFGNKRDFNVEAYDNRGILRAEYSNT